MRSCKIVILGDQGAGETGFMKIANGEKFIPHVSPTIGATFYSMIAPRAHFKFHIWDTSGAPRYSNMLNMYAENVMAAIIILDATKTPTHNKEKLITYLSLCLSENQDRIPVLISLSHLDEENRLSGVEDVVKFINSDVCLEFRKKLNFIRISQHSAKTGENIKECFELLTKEFYFTVSPPSDLPNLVIEFCDSLMRIESAEEREQAMMKLECLARINNNDAMPAFLLFQKRQKG